MTGDFLGPKCFVVAPVFSIVPAGSGEVSVRENSPPPNRPVSAVGCGFRRWVSRRSDHILRRRMWSGEDSEGIFEGGNTPSVAPTMLSPGIPSRLSAAGHPAGFPAAPGTSGPQKTACKGSVAADFLHAEKVDWRHSGTVSGFPEKQRPIFWSYRPICGSKMVKWSSFWEDTRGTPQRGMSPAEGLVNGIYCPSTFAITGWSRT
jgi:hypothetical protein